MESIGVKYDNTDIYHLLPKRNFWTGFSSILCLMGEPRKFNYSKSHLDADTNALKSDWTTIGRDFMNAISLSIAA